MKLKPALWFLLFASLLDAIFTDTGLRIGGMVEANPFIRYIYEHAYYLFYPIKLTLPILLLWIIPKISSRLYIRIMVQTTSAIYGFVLILHVLWLTQYSYII